MNRLVIIGNGFDLAHGLPTSYKHFIDDYWKNVIEVCKDKDVYGDDLFSLGLSKNSIGPQGCYELYNNVKCYRTLKEFTIRNGKYCTRLFKNNFFSDLSDITSIENWVDIENLYYKKLKIITKSDSSTIEQKKIHAIILNQEFEQVKNLLEKYLGEKVLAKYRFESFSGENQDWIKIYEKLKPISLLSNEENILKEFSNLNDRKKIEANFLEERKQVIVNKLYFLNFNYTPTIVKYSGIIQNDRIETKVNFIHGKILDKVEPINFGFGDEMDDDYRFIENINNNEYLRNFKSFQYLQNSNYNDLLSYIDSEKFQVYIMGHSCGLSDRTLLNTIFEHNNCRSIKVFYHETKDENDKVIRDNYTEIVQNISRHFNKKALMREKIVNKTLCEPLPQIQLPIK